MNISLPLVSIGLSAYNRPEGLVRTLNCLLNQTYQNIEIILSNDCSIDLKVNVVISKYLSDKRIVYYDQPQNIGSLKNQNFVLEKATGEFFMRLADDDWVDVNYVESCLSFLLENEGYSGAYGAAKIYNLNDEFLRNDPQIRLVQDTGTERVLNYLQHVECNGTYYGLIRKLYFPYLFTENQLADDWLVVSRIAFLGKYKMIENANCYITTGGISSSFESIVQNLNLHGVAKYFPYISISLNVIKDIIWGSVVYRKINFLGRLKLALKSFIIIFKRFNVKSEIKQGLKKIVRLSLRNKQKQLKALD